MSQLETPMTRRYWKQVGWHSAGGIPVVQTKAQRLGMSLLGQALFSRLLIEDRFATRSVRTIALCAADDAVLRPLAERFGIEVVVDGPTSTTYA